MSIAKQLCEICQDYDRSLIVGINGAQGSGKSTLAKQLANVLVTQFHKRVVYFSLDDFYKTKEERQLMAKEVHPLFITRGVPGTHDVELALSVLQDLLAGRSTKIPVFDKALDDRLPEVQWQIVESAMDIVIFEGWCVGAKPQANEELDKPVNDLEAGEDIDSVWRRLVNQHLAARYQGLFAMIDYLIMMKVADFSVVFENRLRQERELALATERVMMSADEIRRFIQHYQRLTEFMLAEMPSRADLVLPAYDN